MAADSRAVYWDGRVDDKQCKVIALGDKLLFGAVGIQGVRSRTSSIHSWEAVAEARRAFAHESARGPGDIGRIAAYWESAIKQHLTEQLAYDPDGVIHSIQKDGPVLSMGVFAGKNPDGKLGSIAMMVSCDTTSKQFPCSADHIRKHLARLNVQKLELPAFAPTVKFEPFGVSGTFARFENAPEKLSADELGIWNSVALRSAIKDPDAQRAVKFIDLTILYDRRKAGVGGDVDVVELTRSGGVTWLNRKQGCPAD
jgi:hypothetical protein